MSLVFESMYSIKLMVSLNEGCYRSGVDIYMKHKSKTREIHFFCCCLPAWTELPLCPWTRICTVNCPVFLAFGLGTELCY